MSTLLFNIVLEKIIRMGNLNREGHLGFKSHQVAAYADDIAIIARGKKPLKDIITKLIEAAQKMDLHINQEKSNLLIVENKAEPITLDIEYTGGQVSFKGMKEFVYL